jgi:hypothetical protein
VNELGKAPREFAISPQQDRGVQVPEPRAKKIFSLKEKIFLQFDSLRFKTLKW